MALSSLSSNSQKPLVPFFSEPFLKPQKLDPQTLHSRIEIAKKEHARLEKIALAEGENEEHRELFSMLHDLSHSNLQYATVALRDKKYTEASRHIDNVHKAAYAMSQYVVS